MLTSTGPGTLVAGVTHDMLYVSSSPAMITPGLSLDPNRHTAVADVPRLEPVQSSDETFSVKSELNKNRTKANDYLTRLLKCPPILVQCQDRYSMAQVNLRGKSKDSD